MSIFDWTLSLFGKKMLPPDKRLPRTVALVNVFMLPLQWLRDLWFGDYRQGAADGPSGALPWLISTTYTQGQRVTYKQKMYESLANANLGNLPTDQNNWVVRLQNFIGTDERLCYNGSTLTLTYALNKYFGTVFRQPPGTSDIYLTTQTNIADSFIVGASEAESSAVYATTSSEYIINDFSTGTFYNLTIHVPSAVFAALDPSPANAEAIIRSFANTYIVGGVIYNVVTY